MTVLMNAADQHPPPDRAPATRGTARRGLRAGVVTSGLVLGSWVATAAAAPPEGWDNATNDSALTSMLKLFGIPVVVIVVVTLLTYLPVLVRGGRGSADTTGWFAEHSEWFGGPRTTPEALESRVAAVEGQGATRGGASARW